MVRDHELESAFPSNVDPQFIPFGTRVLIQLRRAQTMSKGGIALVSETVLDRRYMEQIAMVHSMGALAFKIRSGEQAMQPWPEGIWCEVGDFVSVPKFGGDRWVVDIGDGGEPVSFVLFNDYEIFGKITGNPLTMRVTFG